MSRLAVEFDLPTEILHGLLDGEYTRCGGIIRDGNGKIVKHLIETGQYLNANDISFIQQLKALNLMGGLTLTTNLLTLGVMSVGFLVMNQKFTKIEKELYNIKKNLQRIETKIDFIQDQLDVKLLAKLQTAISIAQGALLSKENRKYRFFEAQNIFIEVQHEIYGLEKKIQERYGIVPCYQLYTYYTICYAAAVFGEIKCALYLNDHEIAISRITEASVNIDFMRNQYLESFNPRRIQVQQMAHNEVAVVKRHLGEFDEIYNRMGSAEEQIRMLLRNDLSYVDLDEMCSRRGDTTPIMYISEIINE